MQVEADVGGLAGREARKALQGEIEPFSRLISIGIEDPETTPQIGPFRKERLASREPAGGEEGSAIEAVRNHVSG